MSVSYNEDQVQTALCVWEWMLERNRSEKAAESTEEYPSDFMACWDEVGTSAMRQIAVDIAPWVDEVYQKLPEQRDDAAFDWEIVPAIMHTFTWDPMSGRANHGTVEETVSEVRKDLGWS